MFLAKPSPSYVNLLNPLQAGIDDPAGGHTALLHGICHLPCIERDIHQFNRIDVCNVGG